MRLKRLLTGLAGGCLLATVAQTVAAGTPLDATPQIAAAPIADTELADLSGGQDTSSGSLAVILNNLTSSANGNNVIAGGAVTSGAVSLGQGAFQGFSGVGNFVINTGFNNSLQGSLSVAIDMAPAGTH